MPRRWNGSLRAHWRIENGSHYVRDTAFAEDASRIRKNPDIAARLRSFAYNLIRAAGGSNIRTLAGAPPSISTSSSNCRASIESKQPCPERAVVVAWLGNTGSAKGFGQGRL